MPIITPAYPQQNSTYNVSTSTRTVIMEEFRLGKSSLNIFFFIIPNVTCYAYFTGLNITEDIMLGKCSWDKLFEPPPFFMRYRHFIVLLVCSLSAEDQLEWCGLVTSKLRLLIGNLERNQHIMIAHVNPEMYEMPMSNGQHPALAPPGILLNYVFSWVLFNVFVV
jgi:poly(A) polymerase